MSIQLLLCRLENLLWNYLEMYNNSHNTLSQMVLVVLSQIIILCLKVRKIKTRILNILRLISTKLDAAIVAVADKRLVTASPYGRVANRAYDPVGSDNMEDAQREIGSHDGLRQKTPYIKKPEANQIKVDTITEATADQRLTATSTRRRVTNRVCDSGRSQQNIRTQVAKFVQNADAQEQAKK